MTMQDMLIDRASRLFWRLPRNEDGSTSKVSYREGVTAVFVATFSFSFLVLFSRKTLGSALAAVNWTALVLIHGSVRLGLLDKALPNSRFVLRRASTPRRCTFSLSRQTATRAVLGLRAVMSLMSLVAMPASFVRLPFTAYRLFSQRAVQLEWAALGLCLVDIGYWQLHSGKYNGNRLAWI